MATTLGKALLGFREERPITWGDVGRGLLYYIKLRGSKEALSVKKGIQLACDERCFGDGEVYDNRTFAAPVYAITYDGKLITIALGKPGTSRAGQMLVADGHIELHTFYGGKLARALGYKLAKGHDHFGSDGTLHNDRGSTS